MTKSISKELSSLEGELQKFRDSHSLQVSFRLAGLRRRVSHEDGKGGSGVLLATRPTSAHPKTSSRNVSSPTLRRKSFSNRPSPSSASKVKTTPTRLGSAARTRPGTPLEGLEQARASALAVLRSEEPHLTSSNHGRDTLRRLRACILQVTKEIQDYSLRQSIPSTFRRLHKRLQSFITALRRHEKTGSPGIHELHKMFSIEIPTLTHEFEAESEAVRRLPEVKAWLDTAAILNDVFSDTLQVSPDIRSLLVEITKIHANERLLRNAIPEQGLPGSPNGRRSTADKDDCNSQRLVVSVPNLPTIQELDISGTSSTSDSPMSKAHSGTSLETSSAISSLVSVDALESMPSRSTDVGSDTPSSDGVESLESPYGRGAVLGCGAVLVLGKTPLDKVTLTDMTTAVVHQRYGGKDEWPAERVKSLVDAVIESRGASMTTDGISIQDPSHVQRITHDLLLDSDLVRLCHQLHSEHLKQKVDQGIRDHCKINVDTARAIMSHWQALGPDGLQQMKQFICDVDLFEAIIADVGVSGLSAFVKETMTELVKANPADLDGSCDLFMGVLETHADILNQFPSGVVQVAFNLPRKHPLFLSLCAKIASGGMHKPWLQDSGHDLVVPASDPNHTDSYSDLAKLAGSAALQHVSVHPDHPTRFVTASAMASVSIWRMNSELAKVASVAQVGAESVLATAWSADGSCIAIGCDSGPVLVLDPAGNGRDILMNNQDDISAIAFGDGSIVLITASADGSIIYHKREPVDEFAEPDDPFPTFEIDAQVDLPSGTYCTSLCPLPRDNGDSGDGRLEVLIGASDGQVYVWRAGADDQLQVLAKCDSEVTHFSLPGMTLSGHRNDDVKVVDALIGCSDGSVYTVPVKGDSGSPTLITKHNGKVLALLCAVSGTEAWSIGGDGILRTYQFPLNNMSHAEVEHELVIIAPLNNKVTSADIVATRWSRPDVVVGLGSGAWKRLRLLKPEYIHT